MMDRFKNHYRALGVDSTADDATIKAAFRRLALRYHPDRGRSARTARRFREIRAAYEVLSDPEKRPRYDYLYRAHTALRPITGGLERPRGRTGSAGVGITLDLLGIRIGLALAAGVSRRATRPPKSPPPKGPPRRPPPGP